MTDLSKVKNRDALEPRREPYWHKISQSNHLGFRKINKNSRGTWLARAYESHFLCAYKGIDIPYNSFKVTCVGPTKSKN